MKLSVADLDLKGKRVFIRVDFNVPLKDGAIGDDTRINGVAADDHVRARSRRDRRSSPRHLGRPKGKADARVQPEAGRATTGRAARPAGRRSPTTASASRDEGGRPKRRRQSRRPAREPALPPEEEKNDPAFAQQLASLADALRQRRVRRGAPRARVGRRDRHSHLRAAAAGLLMEKELAYLGHALDNAGAAVRGDPRRREGLGQDRASSRTCSARSTRCSSAARWPTRSSRRAACRSASRWSRTTSSTRRDGSRRRRKQRGVSLLLPVDHVVAPKLEAGAPHEVLAVGDPAIGDRMGARHRPGDDRRPTRRSCATRRPWCGTARWACSRSPRSPTGTNAVARAVAAVNGTTIVGGGDSIAAVKKAGVADRDHAHLHRRRRVARVPRRPDAARRRGADGQVGIGATDMRIIPFIAGNWKMFKTVARGGRVRQGAAQPREGRRPDVEIVVAPPFTASTPWPKRRATRTSASPRRICYWEREGAFTGEVSAPR